MPMIAILAVGLAAVPVRYHQTDGRQKLGKDRATHAHPVEIRDSARQEG
jgi:hypothetical protein